MNDHPYVEGARLAPTAEHRMGTAIELQGAAVPVGPSTTPDELVPGTWETDGGSVGALASSASAVVTTLESQTAGECRELATGCSRTVRARTLSLPGTA
jgi:hypothetical protein